MNWPVMRDALIAQVRAISGVDNERSVAWADSAEGAAFRAFPHIDLSVRSVISYGDDESRIDIDQSDEPTEYLSGPRRFTWTIKVEADGSSDDALTLADRIRARLRRNTVRAELASARMAIASIEPTQPLSYKTDGRSYQVAVIDVLVNAVENDVDDSDEAGNTIRDAEVASEYLTDPDGGNNPRQISITVETP